MPLPHPHSPASKPILEELIRRSLALANRLLRPGSSTIQTQDAEDIAAETYLAVLRHWDDFASEADLWRQLGTIVAHKVRDRFRASHALKRASGTPELPLDTAHEPARTPDPSEEAIAEELREALRDCIEQLPADSREVILLRLIQGLNPQAASELIGTSIDYTNTLLCRARRRLAACLEKKDHHYRAES